MTRTICQNCMHLNVCKYTNKMALVESKCSEVFKEHSPYSLFTHDDDIVLGYPLEVTLSCKCFLCKADEEDGNKGQMPLPEPYKEEQIRSDF